MHILETGVHVAKWGALIGLAAGIIYSVGGFVVDLLTIGLNWGTAMAFGALLGMPALFAAAGFAVGIVGALVRGGFRALSEPR